MNRAARALLWFVVGVLLGGAASLSFAETIPSSQQQGSPTLWWRDYSQTGTVYTSQSFSSQCTYEVPVVYGSGYTGVVSSGGVCQVKRNSDGVVITSQSISYQWRCSITNQIISSGNSSNQTVTTPTFTCGSGTGCPTTTWGGSYTLDPGGATCSRPDPCPKDQLVSGPGYYDVGSTWPSNVRLNGCAPNGCFAVFSGSCPAAVALVGGQTHYFCKGSIYLAGGDPSQCVGGGVAASSGATAPASTCAAGQQMGTVNGKTVCIDPTTGQGAQTQQSRTTTTTSSQTTDPGSGNVTTTTTTTNPDGSKSVTVSVTTSGGQPVSSQTTTTPAATGAAGPVDPNKTEDPYDPCADHPDRLGCVEQGTPENQADLTSKEVGPSSIVAVSMPGINSCPADIPLPRGAVFSFAPICNGMNAIRPVVLSVAWLGAILIVFGARRES